MQPISVEVQPHIRNTGQQGTGLLHYFDKDFQRTWSIIREGVVESKKPQFHHLSTRWNPATTKLYYSTRTSTSVLINQFLLNPSDFPEELSCTEDEVLELLDCNKSTGPDDISARVLKATASSIAPSLARLFNLSLTSGCFPDSWKLVRVVPIPKSTDSSSPSNYRPISL